MRSNTTRVLLAGLAAAVIGVYAEMGKSAETDLKKNDPLDAAVGKGIAWLVSVQGKDGGWGQDGGETSYVRQGERLESSGNDLANTAVAAEALLRTGNTMSSGPHRENLQAAVEFILQRVEASAPEGLAVTDVRGTQIQRKLGPYIDTFLTAKLLGDLDGAMGNIDANARVRKDLRKCVAKIEKNQLKDGSWNVAGAWAPIFGTSLASQSLAVAQGKGVGVSPVAMARVESYTMSTVTSAAAAPPPLAAATPTSTEAKPIMSPSSPVAAVAYDAPLARIGPASGGAVGGVGSGYGGGVGSASGGGVGPGSGGTIGYGAGVSAVAASSAGVSLYKRAQELEQLSRTAKDREQNAKQIGEIETQLSDPRFVTGFGSVGGEEFFSYLNISDSMHRAGGPKWEKWNADMKTKILQMQNADGTWAGHHCITGRVAVTSAAILNLLVDREPIVQTTSLKKK